MPAYRLLQAGIHITVTNRSYDLIYPHGALPQNASALKQAHNPGKSQID
jgi:hypothetical protein